MVRQAILSLFSADYTSEIEASFVNIMEHVENNVVAVFFAHLHFSPPINLFSLE